MSVFKTKKNNNKRFVVDNHYNIFNFRFLPLFGFWDVYKILNRLVNVYNNCYLMNQKIVVLEVKMHCFFKMV